AILVAGIHVAGPQIRKPMITLNKSAAAPCAIGAFAALFALLGCEREAGSSAARSRAAAAAAASAPGTAPGGSVGKSDASHAGQQGLESPESVRTRTDQAATG